MIQKKFAVILAGCGSMDGAEINEAVMTLYALSCNDIQASIFAPDMEQAHVVNHLSNTVVEGQSRNILHEAARIARGAISPLTELDMAEHDSVILVGGYGGAKNFSDFAFKGEQMSVDSEIERVILDAHKMQKPIGAMCISPVVVACALKGKSPVICTGADKDTAKIMTESFGAIVAECGKTECTIDNENLVVTTPTFMYPDITLCEMGKGCDAMVKALLKLAK